MSKVTNIRANDTTTELIAGLTKAHQQNKLLDIAIVYRRKRYDNEDTAGPDGEKVHSMVVYHVAGQGTFTAIGMVDSLKDYVKGFLGDDDRDEIA